MRLMILLTKVYLLDKIHLFFTFEEKLEMEQYYISQAQQSQTTPSAPAQFSYTDPAFTIACLAVMLNVVLGAVFLRVNNKLTFIDGHKKDLDNRDAVLNNKQVTLMVEEENPDLKKSIFNIETQVTKLTQTVETMSQNMVTKEEFQAGMTQVNNRITNPVKGTKNEEA